MSPQSPQRNVKGNSHLPACPEPPAPPAPPTEVKPQVATAEDFFAEIRTPVREPVEMRSGKIVYVHAISDVDIEQWRASCERNDQGVVIDPYAPAKLMMATVHDERGNRLFTEEAHRFKLGAGLRAHTSRVVDTAMRLNVLTKEAEDEIRKNSLKIRSSGSGSD